MKNDLHEFPERYEANFSDFLFHNFDKHFGNYFIISEFSRFILDLIRMNKGD